MQVEIYTDGACSGNPGPGGYGVILKYRDTIKELSAGYQRTTNNRMELMAVIKGLEALKAACRVSLFSDSKYIVDAINKGWLAKWQQNQWTKSDRSRVKNIDLWKIVASLQDKHDITWNWVKGHAENEFNNRCDVLAVNASKNALALEDVGYQE
ncbi:MAG: ribonuclease HI [Peptococcaceae bacterium]|nr:ribonuclease HI [Peptococcaceae bacterium]